jgi:uncharacterized protein YraI
MTMRGKDNKEEIQSKPEVFALHIEDGEKKYTRRHFLELTAAASAAMALSGCTLGPLEITVKKSPTPTAVPTDTPLVPSDTPTPVPTDTPPLPTDTPTITPSPTPEATSTFTLTPTQEAKAVVNVASVNFRAGPGQVYNKISYLYKNDELDILGRTLDGQWLEVVTKDGVKGWLSITVVNINVSIDSIPIQDNIPPTPTPVVVHGLQGTVKPGKTGINYTYNGVTYTLPCGSDIPPGAVCVCNCVTVKEPKGCTCDEHAVDTHYWYPN